MAPRNKAPIFVATQSFACEINGQRYNVSKGERVREGHELLRAQADSFEPADDQPVQYDVEQATASPGEKRGDR